MPLTPLLAAVLLLSLLAWPSALARPALTGQAVTEVGDVGEHYPLFLVEKSYHPGNITVVYTTLDAHCHVLPDRTHGSQPTLDFYWLMDETHYKPMAGLLKDGIRQRLVLTDVQGAPGDGTAFAVRLNDLSRVQHDLPRPTVQIKTARHGASCVARAYLTLGPSDGQTTMKLGSIVIQTEDLTLRKKMQALADPDALRIYAVTVKGADVATGQPIERRYPAAH